MDTFARIRPIWFVVGAIIIIVIVVSMIFSASNNSSNRPKTANKTVAVPKTLTDFAVPGTSVSFTQDGLINANQPHRSINITVSSSSSNITIYEGYDGKVLNSATFANNENAYAQFLAALKNVGYTIKRSEKVPDSEVGQCPLGYRYTFVNNNMPGLPESLWTTSCGTVKGSYGGNFINTKTLFTRQIPGYNQLTANINL